MTKKNNQEAVGTGSSDDVGRLSEDGESEDDTNSKDATELPLDEAFELLKNSRRRQTLQYLTEHDGQSDIGELSEHIAAIENDTTVDAISSEQRKRVYVGLYQVHLPTLDEADAIEFDRDRGTVEQGANAEQLHSHIRQDRTLHWQYAYVGLTVIGAGLLAGSLVSALPPTAVAILLVVALAVSSGIHTYVETRDEPFRGVR